MGLVGRKKKVGCLETRLESNSVRSGSEGGWVEGKTTVLCVWVQQNPRLKAVGLSSFEEVVKDN